MRYYNWVILSLFGTVFLIGGCFQKAKRVYIPELPPHQIVTVKQMQEDLEYTVDVLRQVHPQTLKGFNDRQLQLIESLRADINQPMPAYQFYVKMNTLFCAMKDGHTHLYAIKNKENKVIDASFTWLRDGLYAKTDSEYFKQGDQILTIADKSLDDVFTGLDKMIPSENAHWTYYKGAHCLTQQSYLEALRLLREGCVDFQIQRGQKQMSISVPLVAQTDNKKKSSRKPWVRYEIDEDHSLGIFYLDACRFNDKYKKTVKAFFTEINQNGIQHVVIDVRRNGGGNSLVVDEFLKYINVDQYLSFGCEIRRSKASAEQNGTPSSGYRKYKNDKPKKNYKHKDPNLLFDGKLYIMTSAQTFSSGNWFAVIIKDNQLGIVIGEPTGNQPSSYGDCLLFQMPNSGYRFNVSFKKWIRPDTNRNSYDALYPDVPLYTTIDDIVHQRDPQLDKVKELIVQSKDVFPRSGL